MPTKFSLYAWLRLAHRLHQHVVAYRIVPLSKQHYIILIHPIEDELKTRVDFDTELGEEALYDYLKLEGYKVYQFIRSDFHYLMSNDELKALNVKFATFDKKVKTWFGLDSKIEQDLLIYPKEGFYYPYQYGWYLYLYSKADIGSDEFINWLNEQMPYTNKDFDNSYAGLNYKTLKPLHDDDYILVTSHDYQRDFGITASKEITKKLVDRIKEADFEALDIEQYVQKI